VKLQPDAPALGRFDRERMELCTVALEQSIGQCTEGIII
jgi:hypothetical protein